MRDPFVACADAARIVMGPYRLRKRIVGDLPARGSRPRIVNAGLQARTQAAALSRRPACAAGPAASRRSSGGEVRTGGGFVFGDAAPQRRSIRSPAGDSDSA